MKEWLFLLGALLTLGGFIGWSAVDEHAAIEAREREHLTAQSKILHDSLSRHLDSVSRALNSVRNDVKYWESLPDGMGRATLRLRAFVDAMPGVRTMTIISAQGKILAANRSELIGLMIPEREYFQVAQQNPDLERFYISPPFLTSLGVWSMNVVRVIPGENGKFAGIVAATLDPEEFRMLLDAVNRTPDMWSALAHGDGKLFLTMPARPDLQGTDLAQPGSFFNRHRQSGEAASVLIGKVMTTGEYRMMAQRTVQPAALKMDRALVIAISRDMAVLYAGWRDRLRAELSLFALLALSSTGGLFLLQRRRRSAEKLLASANAALAGNEHFLRSLIDIIPGMVGYWSAELRCGFANKSYREWFGRDPAQMHGMPIQELLGAELFKRNEPFIRQALRGEACSFERSLTKADGSTGHTWAHYIPDILDGEVRGFFVLVSDISDIKQKEIRLRAALTEAERFREALDYVSSFIYMKDASGRYVYANQPTLDLFGVRAEELPGSADERFFPPATVQRLREVDARVLAGEHTEEEIEVLDETGRRRTYWEIKTPIFSDGETKEVWGLCGISTDITERKQIESALLRSTLRLSEAQRIARIGDWEFDLLTRQLTWSDEVHRIFEIDKAQFDCRYETFLAAVHPEDRDTLHENYQRGLATGLSRVDFSHRLLLPDGRIKYVQQRGETLYGEDGKPLRSVGTVQDITERRLAEMELEHYRHHLEHLVEERTTALTIAKEAAETASRAKSTFLANMSHELRTPMNAIMGMAAIALRRTEEPKLRDYLGKIDQASQHLLVLINDILDLSKIEAERLTLERVPFTLGGLIDKLTGMIGQRAVDKGLLLNIHLPAELAGMSMLGDPLRLGQVLLNLVGNAIKFTQQGRVELRVQALDTRGDTAVLRFEVSDTGVGISAEDQRRLFTAFEQADNSMTRKYGGTGLGLAISKRLVGMMGGDIGISSKPGEGSTFWFIVQLDRLPGQPLLSSLKPDNLPSAEVRLRHECAGCHILLVEDEPINQEVSYGLLADVGLQVDRAEDGTVALALARQNRYDLILMDVQMPKMNGIDATREIRKLPGYAEVPILAMTANAFSEDRQICLDAGMNDHLSKPVDPDRLFEALVAWLLSRSQ
jgi:PAS domain S-box-containing protein